MYCVAAGRVIGAQCPVQGAAALVKAEAHQFPFMISPQQRIAGLVGDVAVDAKAVSGGKRLHQVRQPEKFDAPVSRCFPAVTRSSNTRITASCAVMASRPCLWKRPM